MAWTLKCLAGRYWVASGKGRKMIEIATVADVEDSNGDTDPAATLAHGLILAASSDLLAACECVMTGEPHAMHDVIAAVKKARGK